MVTNYAIYPSTVRDENPKEDPTERGEALCVVTIFSGGYVQSRMNVEKVETDEQREWVRHQLDLAKTDKNLAGGAA